MAGARRSGLGAEDGGAGLTKRRRPPPAESCGIDGGDGCGCGAAAAATGAACARRREGDCGEARSCCSSDSAAAGAKEASSKPEAAGGEAEPVWSSGVVFYPPSRKYWRIGGKWYDFADFLQKHPGGATVLMLARDRFEDCTFVFESHHHNYQKVRAIIKKYEVSEEAVLAEGIARRPKRGEQGAPSFLWGTSELPGHHDDKLDSGEAVQLLGHEAFYSVLRRRVTDHLREVGHPDGGPTTTCVALFWISFVAWMATLFSVWWTGAFVVAILHGLAASWLGAFGHNWVHQPKYKFWAYLSLDTVGFSSDGWFREHLLQHHMYTNTPWDNHFKGTAPWLVTDPTVERNFVQKYVFPYLNPAILCFGLYANYIAHLVELIKGNEVCCAGKLLLPLQLAMLVSRWGWLYGFLLQFTSNAVMGMYYFTMALMNHNAEHCLDVTARNTSRDWAIAQLNSSADWAVGSSFLGASRYLWLNFHTVHHLFPLVDFSHHPAIQNILMRTCEEFDVNYRAGEVVALYKEMVRSFGSPLSLMQEVVVYAGGL